MPCPRFNLCQSCGCYDSAGAGGVSGKECGGHVTKQRGGAKRLCVATIQERYSLQLENCPLHHHHYHLLHHPEHFTSVQMEPLHALSQIQPNSESVCSLSLSSTPLSVFLSSLSKGTSYHFDWILRTHPKDYSGEMEGKHSKTLKLSKVQHAGSVPLE